MTTAIQAAPPNSVILVEDFGGGEVPKSMSQSLVAATLTCIAVGCRAEDDGETEIIVGLDNELNVQDPVVFEGRLRTPSGRLVIRNVLGATLLEMPVTSSTTELRILANDPHEPDRITVGIVVDA